jgi:thiol-disulfide isomerase/thioredoxin
MTSPQKRRNAQTLENYLAANKHEQTRKEFKDNFVLFRVYSRLKNSLLPCASAFLVCVVFLSADNSFAQTRKKTKSIVPAKKTKVAPKNIVSNLPKVTQIDVEALKNLLKPNGKPFLINFWATWCEPCREEFPDLVKIGADYKDKIDLITVSLDELSEINGDVPKFLAEMRAEMPSYLLKTPSEEAAIAAVSKDWQGGLPFTILFNEKGEAVYFKQGKFQTEILRQELEKLAIQGQLQK